MAGRAPPGRRDGDQTRDTRCDGVARDAWHEFADRERVSVVFVEKRQLWPFESEKKRAFEKSD